MKFRADEITSLLIGEIEHFQSEVTRTEVGRVLEVGDGIARVHGLSGVMTGEMVAFEGGVKGLAFNLEESSVGVIILGDYTQIHEGETVTATGELLSVPVGEAMVGRVVNPLGVPIDNKGPIATDRTRLVESPAPGIADRQPVDEPMQTGIKAIDAMTPVGRGQRELIIGDRKTGKTAIAIDAILSQKGQGVICVYVAIAQKESTTAALVEVLRKYGAMDYTIVVAAGASDPAPLQYLAPVRRHGDGRILHVREGRRDALRLRRPLEAGRRLPRAVALAPPPAGARGVSGRRLLRPLPAVGAVGEAGQQVRDRPCRRADRRPRQPRDRVVGRRRQGLCRRPGI